MDQRFAEACISAQSRLSAASRRLREANEELNAAEREYGIASRELEQAERLYYAQPDSASPVTSENEK